MEVLSLSDPPISASQSARIIGWAAMPIPALFTYYFILQIFFTLFFEMESHSVAQAGVQ